MKIKRKNASNGVKSSPNCDTKSDSKLEINNSEIFKKILTSTLQNKSTDKNADHMNGTSNGSVTNADSIALAKKSFDVKNLQFKEKKKQANNVNGNKACSSESNGSNNQLDTTNSLSRENENDKSQSTNDRLSIYDKETNESTNNNLLANDRNKLTVNSSLIASNNSSSIAKNKTNENHSDLSSKDESSSSSKSGKRELDSSLSDMSLKKKLKIDNENSISATNVSTMTESDCLGFAEPGTSVVLEGAVLDEIEGVLVVNVTWRGKMYVGTLLDCSKHDWAFAPPRFCESPSSDLESRGGNRNRNCKRSRGSISEAENNIKLQPSKLRNGKGRRNFTVPESPAREQQSNNSGNGNTKRSTNSKSDNSNNKQRSSPPLDSTNNNSTSSTSQSNQTNKNQLSSPVLIECPEPNCNKKYKHINGLKYHQAHAHHETNNNTTSKSVNNNSPSLNANKNDELSESTKNNEETDIEEFAENENNAVCTLDEKNKTTANKMNKNSKSSKESEEERTISNKSPYSDISETDNESRPSSNENEQTSQFTNNSSAKNDEINESSTTIQSSINSQTKHLDTAKGSSSSFPVLCPPSLTGDSALNSSENNKNSKSSFSNKTDQKTNEELRRIGIESEKKFANEIVEQHSTDKLLLANSLDTTSQLNNSPSTVLTKTNAVLFPPENSMNPALHAYFLQTDPNYRTSYGRYLIEHQEKLIGSLTSNELSEFEKERHKAFLLAQNSAYINSNNNNDNVFKLPPTTSANSTRRSPTKSNEYFISGGSITNSTCNLSQSNDNNSNKNIPSPYDFMESEKQLERQNEEMFRLSNSFKMEEQRLLQSKQPISNSSPVSSSPQSNKKSIKDSVNQSNGANKVIKSDEGSKESIEKINLPINFSNSFNFSALPFLTSTSNGQQLSMPPSLASFSSPTQTPVHHMSFDPNLYRNGQSPLLHQTGNINSNSLPQSQTQPAFFNSLRLSGLSPIDLNCGNASKYLAAQSTPSNQLLNNKKIENSIHHERSLISPKSALGNNLLADNKLTSNGLHRTLNANLSQNSSTMLNTSNNSNLSTSSKKDENRSSPSRHLNNNVPHVGFPTFIDPYGELIQQATVTACMIPFASK